MCKFIKRRQGKYRVRRWINSGASLAVRRNVDEQWRTWIIEWKQGVNNGKADSYLLSLDEEQRIIFPFESPKYAIKFRPSFPLIIYDDKVLVMIRFAYVYVRLCRAASCFIKNVDEVVSTCWIKDELLISKRVVEDCLEQTSREMIARISWVLFDCTNQDSCRHSEISQRKSNRTQWISSVTA